MRFSTIATTSSIVPPSSAAVAAVRQRLPRPIVSVLLSTTRTGTVSATDLAASSAAANVAERAEERLMQTTPSAPSVAAWRKASSNAPGEGAAVSGRTADDAQRDQNS